MIIRYEKNEPQSVFNGISKDSRKVLEKENLRIFKDSSGKDHRYLAVCTHLGCNLVWNNLEKSFDVLVMVQGFPALLEE